MNRVALITGAAVRVGRAIAEHLAARGFDVCFTYHHSQAEAEELNRVLRDAGRTGLAVQADLTRPEAAVEAIVGALRGTWERLDVLVHNASIYAPSALGRVDLALARRMMAVHYESPLLLTATLAPMLRRSRGHVISMLDLLVDRPWPEFLGYAASKGALRSLTLGLARELAPEVTVNGIAPGVVAWPDDYPEASRQKYLQRVPLGHPGTPQDVASLVYYLATEGRYVTGQVIRLDGGRSVT